MKTLILLLLLLPFVVRASAGMPALPSAAKVAETLPAGPLRLDRYGLNFIVKHETGGAAYYDRALRRPTWPGGASGVTIGVGYDIGYNTQGQFRSDWAHLGNDVKSALANTAGVNGQAAKYRVSALKWISIPWVDAEKVFVAKTLPRFGTVTSTTFPGSADLNVNRQAALLSLVFNRGGSLSGSKRVEMRAIREHVRGGRNEYVPAEFRRMKKYWVGKGLDGLLRRRDEEADLFASPVR